MSIATAEPFQAPTVESLSVRVVVDLFFDQFMPKQTHPNCRVEHVSRIRGRETSTLAGEWGLSLHLESRGLRRSETGRTETGRAGSTCSISATRRKSCCAISTCSASRPKSSTG